MILFGLPRTVQHFFAPVTRSLARPIRRALAPMVLALLLAPHRRCLKTLGGAVLGDRVHASTISRRLRNARWHTWDWYVDLYDRTLGRIHDWERQQPCRGQPGQRRRWALVLDTTYHGTHSQDMENLLLINRRRDPHRRHMHHHAFIHGLIITEYGFRIPLPRRSYYTREYCALYQRRYRTQVQLAADMLREVQLPADVDVMVLFDGAFDAAVVHQACRDRGFHAVFPIDPNRNLSAGPQVAAAGLAGEKVVHWTRTWTRDEFTLVGLQYANERHAFMRRRHGDNLRRRKTLRHYAAAARHANVSHLGACLIVASYKENRSVPVSAAQPADWWSYHTGPILYQRHNRPQPQRWQAKVLACTDVSLAARQVVEWYEIRWQIELYFRELKSRMQFGCYVLRRFAAVERYVDLLQMGMLLLEQERLQEMQQHGPPSARGGEDWVQARSTDRLRSLEEVCQAWNRTVVEQRLRSARGRRRLLEDLHQVPCHVS